MLRNNLIISSLRRTWQILPDAFRGKSILVVVLLFINSMLELAGLGALLPLFTVLLEENAIEQSSWLRSLYEFSRMGSENTFILLICGVIFGVIVLKNVISALIVWYQGRFSYSLFQYINRTLMYRVYDKGFMWLKQHNTHHIIRDFYSVPIQFTQKMMLAELQLINELLIVSLIIIGIVIYNPQIILILACIVGPAFGLFYRATKHRIHRYRVKINDLSPLIWDTFFDLLYGYPDVKITNSEQTFFRRSHKQIDEFAELNVKSYLLENLPNKVMETALVFGVMVIIGYGLYTFDEKKDLIMLLGIFALAAYRLLPSVNRLMLAILNIRGHQFTFDTLDPIREFRAKPPVPQMESLPYETEIAIQDLRFRYPGKDERVLNDISLTVRKGETLGIIGRSGSGKTTLLNVLLGFLQPESGQIRVDNIALGAENVVAWRGLIGYVQQDIYLTDGTLAENVAFGVPSDQIDFARVEEVIAQASLSEVVAGLDEGIYTRVGEKGSSLSGGQKQRVGIARALYSGAKLLLFDEATSALDNETELEITEAIHRLSGGDLTMLIVAHRHTTLKYCDRILNIENGQLKESLTYQELMQR